MENGSFYCFFVKKNLGEGTEKVEQLQGKTDIAVITLHSFQAAATLKGSLFWIPKRLKSITKA